MKIQVNEKYRMVNLLIQSALNQVRLIQCFINKIPLGEVPSWVIEGLNDQSENIDLHIKWLEQTCLLGLEDHKNLLDIREELTSIHHNLEGSHSGLHDDEYFDEIREEIVRTRDLILYLQKILENAAIEINPKKKRTNSK